jgi:hypothetical protein
MDDGCEAVERLIERGTCPSATLSTIDPPCPDLGSNPGLRGRKPATNRRNYGTAKQVSRSVRRQYRNKMQDEGKVDEFRLLGCDEVCLLIESTCRNNC